jgi:hypothetical protein
MVVRIKRTSDCKTEVEKSLRKLGYDTNPVDQTSLHNKECVVTYGDVDLSVYTQEEYDFNVYIEIEFNLDNNNELPYMIAEIVKNVTFDVEQAVVPWCTSFQFTNSSPHKLGQSTNVTLTAKYEPIYDWIYDR